MILRILLDHKERNVFAVDTVCLDLKIRLLRLLPDNPIPEVTLANCTATAS